MRISASSAGSRFPLILTRSFARLAAGKFQKAISVSTAVTALAISAPIADHPFWKVQNFA
jgi:hypothetical protein